MKSCFTLSVSVQSLSRVWLFVTLWTEASQVSQNILKLMSITLVVPSNHLILCCHLLLLPSIFPSIRVFSSESTPPSSSQSIGALASASVLPMNIQDGFPLGLTGLISLLSKGLSKVFSRTTVWKHQFFSARLLYGPALTSVHDYWKNHKFDRMEPRYWESIALDLLREQVFMKN